uniref:DNA-directed RNA polymerase III subunit RPC5-like n=2 Tax=Hirondellea gigas TaxID=1518452 RepID=A0A2P2HZJ5_9CRUS
MKCGVVEGLLSNGTAEEEDELVDEIPVFLCSSEYGTLYQLVFPSHLPQTLAMDGNIIQARLRPNCKQIELVQRISVDAVYNRSQGEQLALNVDGAHRDLRDNNDNKFPSGMMDQAVLRSEGLLHDKGQYAVGRLIPNFGFTICPINAMMPITPKHDYIDQAEKRVSDEKKAQEVAEEGSNKSEATKAVTVKFQRTENEYMKNARERSFMHHQRIILQEPWVTMQYTGMGHSYGNHLAKQIFHCAESEKVDRFHLPPSHFLSLLSQAPEPTNAPTTAAAPTAAAASAVANASSISSNSRKSRQLDIPKSLLYSFTLDQQIERIVRNAEVMKFSDILDCLEPEVVRAESSIVDRVQTYAVLVQGCWVLKSHLLYPSSDKSTDPTQPSILSISSSKAVIKKTKSGTLHTNMQKTREYALYLLTTKGHLNRKEIAVEAPITADDLLLMLRGIAKPIPTEDGQSSGLWSFLLETDNHFIDKYKAVCQRYHIRWDFQFGGRT